MKKLLALLIFVFAFVVFTSSIAAEGDAATDTSGDASAAGSSSSGSSSGDDQKTGTIIDYLGLNIGLGCAASSFNTPCSDSGTNGMFASVACKVMKAFNAGVIPIYCRIVSHPDYLAAVDGAMTLYVVLLGFGFIFGLVQMNSKELIFRLFKAVVIYALIINADLYFSLVYNTVLQTPQDIVRIMLNSNTGAGSGTGAQNFFEYVDKGMHQILSSHYESQGAEGSGQTYIKTNLKIFMIGLAIWQLGGDLIGGLFFAVVVGWVVNYFSIMIRYLLAMLSMMFVLMLGPIFIPTLLFEQSKYLGDEWIKMLISFILQIVLVVAFVLMVQGFFIQFYDMIKQGLESSAVMQQAPEKMLVTYNNKGDANNGAVGVADRLNSMGYSSAAAETYFNQAFGGNYRDKLPQMILKLIEMMVIVTFSSMFMSIVPSLAALLVGDARFVRLFSGIGFGNKDKLFQANLLGQDQRGVRSSQPTSAAALSSKGDEEAAILKSQNPGN